MARNKAERPEVPAITAVTIEGFKSIAKRTTIEIAPLTILAGANSSGKSSAMQPLLLLKQTLEDSHDPGPLRLHDSHVRFTSTAQVLSSTQPPAQELRIGVKLGAKRSVESTFRGADANRFDLTRTTWIPKEGPTFNLVAGMSGDEVGQIFSDHFGSKSGVVGDGVARERCFLVAKIRQPGVQSAIAEAFGYVSLSASTMSFAPGRSEFEHSIQGILHLQGLRGRPKRTYLSTAVERVFSGTFEPYVASVLEAWQIATDPRLAELGRGLVHLGLTWKAVAGRVDASALELKVERHARRPKGGASDLVNIADVGIGVSQALPVLVALLAAEPGRLVYIEQPELHLHPRAQAAMAEILVEAANRGVRVVCETHSDTLLLGIQTLVAKGKMDPKNVRLHWFERGKDGLTKVTTADLDENGAYGDWPEDFGDVSLETQDRYLDAVQKRAKR
jgi:hypothetical protein